MAIFRDVEADDALWNNDTQQPLFSRSRYFEKYSHSHTIVTTNYDTSDRSPPFRGHSCFCRQDERVLSLRLKMVNSMNFPDFGKAYAEMLMLCQPFYSLAPTSTTTTSSSIESASQGRPFYLHPRLEDGLTPKQVANPQDPDVEVSLKCEASHTTVEVPLRSTKRSQYELTRRDRSIVLGNHGKSLPVRTSLMNSLSWNCFSCQATAIAK